MPWAARNSNPVDEAFLTKHGVLLGQLLWSRGLQNDREIEIFLNPRLDSILPPDLMSDMQRAARRVADAVINNECLCIYGDYDMD